MKIACITSRYGAEIPEGPEMACRLLAEQLATRHDIEVLTTCATDPLTWKNAAPEGTDRIRGVMVRRFANTGSTVPDTFRRYSSRLLAQPTHTPRDEQEWLRRQGPWCPALIEYLRHHQRHFDLFIFFSYRHAPAVLGLGAVEASRAILVPWLSDDAPLALPTLRAVFARPAAIVYVSEAEQQLAKLRVPARSPIEEVVPWGVEAPPPGGLGRRWTEMDERSANRWAAFGPAVPGVGSHLTERGAEFRRRVRLYEPFVICTGRIDPGDGIEEALHYFSRYIEQGGTTPLVLTGDKTMGIPEEPWVRLIGHLSAADRPAALEAASIVLAPRISDTLGLDALNGMAAGTAVLASARNDAAVEHCRRGNAGLYYADGDEFVEALRLLADDERLRNALGKNGREYVRQHARWDVVLGRLERLFMRVHGSTTAAGGERHARRGGR